MQKPKPRFNGLPNCSDQILYILSQNKGKMKRVEIREQLKEMGYSQNCYFLAFNRLERQKKIAYEGSGRSINQIVYLIEDIDEG